MTLKINKRMSKINKTNEDALMNVPGQTFQTPESIPSGMDTLSLAGPAKKKSNKKSKSEPVNLKSKVLTFDDFMKNK